MNILIPMAGNGQRFVDAGFTVPKPFIDVAGLPMIERVVDNLTDLMQGHDLRFIFVVQAAVAARYPYLGEVGEVVVVDAPTAGAACTALLARDYIDNDVPLLIANSDQLVSALLGPWPGGIPDGVILTFNAAHPKWSYAAVDDKGWVWGVAEKQVISNRATCGIYWYKQGRMFVRAADAMIRKNRRVDNEFYIAPVYNEMLAEGYVIGEWRVQKMHGLGTPEDLRDYLKMEGGL